MGYFYNFVPERFIDFLFRFCYKNKWIFSICKVEIYFLSMTFIFKLLIYKLFLFKHNKPILEWIQVK
jgi:hypothetical protein